MLNPARRMLVIASAILVAVATGTGCIASFFRGSGGYDQRPLTIMTQSLFSQRVANRLGQKSWKGDWIFRRDRLELIDNELRNIKPDIMVFQELLEKVGVTAESDRKILGAGSLAEYAWKLNNVERYEDTQEIESLAIATGPAVSLGDSADAGREVWAMGSGGFLSATTVTYEDQPISVFNVQMPVQPDSSYLWYSFIQERVQDRVRSLKHCPKRVIIAGLLPGGESLKRYADLVQGLGLKDASAGFCQIASKCYTGTPTNDIFLATVGDESPSRLDRIFVHQSAILYGSARSMEESNPGSRYAREFGLSRLWASQRFGWVTQVRLGRCNEDELEMAYKK